MKALKTFLAVLLTIAIILASIVVEASVNGRVVFANPAYYRTYLPKLGAYDALYDITMDYFMEQAYASEMFDGQEDLISEVLTEAISQEDFSEYLGQMLGDALDSIAYNRGEMQMPIRDILDDLFDAIENNPKIMELEEDQREMVLNVARDRFSLPADVDDTLREYLYYAFQHDEEKMEQIDYVLDELVHGYAVRLTNTAIASSIILVILLMLLYLVTMDKTNRWLKILSGINIFYIVIYVIITAALVAAIFFVPIRLDADQHIMLTMASTAVTDLVKSVLYISIAATLLLIILKIVFKILIKANIKKENANIVIDEAEGDNI